MPFKTICTLEDESFPPKSKFSVDDIPDLSGKVIIVTGGNAGIGRETCKQLLRKNAKVYLAARDPKKAEKAINELEQETGHRPEFLALDLGNLEAVKRSAEEFKSRETQLHVLFNNAGVMVPPIDQLTSNGYDLQFGTNVVGPFLFTKLLLPLLISTARDSPDGHVRIVNTSSSMSIFTSKIKYNTLRDEPKRKSFGAQKLYSQSKLANVMVSTQFAKRYGGEGIISTSVNPGNIRTELQRHVPGWQDKIMGLILFPVAMGALTQLWAGTSPETATANGKYLIPWAREACYTHPGEDNEKSSELWDWLEGEVKTYL